MIAVIADDFTGAAEIAGISLRYGLSVSLCLDEVLPTAADVLLVSTDSRSKEKEEAIQVTTRVTVALQVLRPAMFYKKTDSVLRGFVCAELQAEMDALRIKKALLVAANPSLGRTIQQGEYFIDGQLINETGFASDPEFPISNASIKAMLRHNDVHVLPPNATMPGKGIVAGEAGNEADIAAWAAIADGGWVLAGAGDFYNAILARQFRLQPSPGFDIQMPHLFISGTAFAKSKAFIRQIQQATPCVAWLPAPPAAGDLADDEHWYKTVSDMLQHYGKAVIAIDDKQAPIVVPAQDLRMAMAKAVKHILDTNHIKEIFIEGGSSAAAILNALNIRQLTVENEWQRGVVRMQAKNRMITVKPGSYDLPERLQRLYLSSPVTHTIAHS